MRSKHTIIFRRVFAFICAMVMGAHFVLPAAAVSVSDTAAETKVVTGEDFVTYFCCATDYSSVIYLNTATGVGSFAVIYADSPTNVYDLTFTIDPTQPLTAAFWQGLSDDCFVRIRSVEPIYIPDAISARPAELAQSSANTRSADTDYFRSRLTAVYGSEHTNLVLRTSSVNGVLFDQKETLEFAIAKSNAHIVKQAISVAGLIASIASFFYSPNVLSVVGLLASVDGMFPAGTELDEYTMTVFCERNVTTSGGSVIRSNTYRYTTHYGYSSTCSDERIFSDAQSPSYIPSQEYFNSATQQFNAAYQHYLNQL